MTPAAPPPDTPKEVKEATVKRQIVIVIDDAASRRLQNPKTSAKELKRLVRGVADELAWGDTGRELQDRDGNRVGSWSMQTTAETAAS
jgi:hypothetical protein